MRLLFVKDRMNWPRAGGHDVHGSQMMRALANRGHEIWLATDTPSPAEAVAGLGLAGELVLSQTPPADPSDLPSPTRLQHRFERYWGPDPHRRLALATITRQTHYDAVIALGPDAPLLFHGVQSGVRIWYAADDPALHHWSRFRLRERAAWGHLRTAGIQALYERSFASVIDRVWVVSDSDRRVMRVLAGRPVDVVPNGVDSEHYGIPPNPYEELTGHCVFWGRLDFGPNEDGLAWFLREVWPLVRRSEPLGRFDVFGFVPSKRVEQMCEHSPGVSLVPNLPDLRNEIARRGVAVLPFVSGRGIKNKLLEAAAMGRAIACTPTALTGTRGIPPVLSARRPSELAANIVRLLHDARLRHKLGTAARQWVTEHHTWDAAAEIAEVGILRQRTRTDHLAGATG